MADSPNTTSLSRAEAARPAASRRTLLMGLAAAAAAPAPMLVATLGDASAVDPIFALIEAHERQTNHRWGFLQQTLDNLEESLPKEQTTWSFSMVGADRWPPEDCADAPQWINTQLDTAAAIEKLLDLELALMTTAPTTIEGAAALLACLGACECPYERGMDGAEPVLTTAAVSYDKRVQDAAEAFPASLAIALRKIAAANSAATA